MTCHSLCLSDNYDMESFKCTIFERQKGFNPFCIQHNIGGEKLILAFKEKLEINFADKYNDFKQDNDKKKKQFEVSFLYLNEEYCILYKCFTQFQAMEKAKARATAAEAAADRDGEKAEKVIFIAATNLFKSITFYC